jgi:thiamine biosynthesis lipoprotein
VLSVLRLVIALVTVGHLSGVRTVSRELARLEDADEAMGSMFSLVLYGPEREQLQMAAEAAFEEVHRLDRLLSNYKTDSEWSRVNREATARPVVVSAELFDLLWACLEYGRQSEGAFDITVGPLMQVWGFYKGDGRMPPESAVAGALERVGSRHVRLDRDARTVRFLRPGVELDPGGVGKGYAVDRMVDVLRKRGVAAALVSAAGSSIYGLGAPPGEPKGWHVPITAPADPRRAVADVYLENLSISTSGSYEKFFWAEGRRYAHIIDPRTGHPARGASSVSVLASHTVDSEAWTKPFFVNGPNWIPRHAPENLRVLFCDDTPHESCRWVR